MELFGGAGTVAVAVAVAGGALLSGVSEASTAVVDSGAGVLDATAGAAVAAHEHTSSPADCTSRPFSTPQACRTHPMAAVEMPDCLAGSHEHFKSPGSQPTDFEAS